MKRGSSGQILIPALFALPSLFLFVVLIFEAAKLSKAKINHQFALDAAASIEMGQYADFLNQLATIDGYFPNAMGYATGEKDEGQPPQSLYPYSDDTNGEVSFDEPQWPIQFHNSYLDAYFNKPVPEDAPLVHLHGGGAVHGITSLGKIQAIFNDYFSNYGSLEIAADNHYALFQDKVLGHHELFKKSLWLNLGNDKSVQGCESSYSTCGTEAAKGFPSLTMNKVYVHEFQGCGTYIGASFNITVLHTPIKIFDGNGLFQLAYIDPPEDLAKLGPREYPYRIYPNQGVLVQQHWIAPTNYFGVDWMLEADAGETSSQKSTGPKVRDRVVATGGNVWFTQDGQPDSTPKFYTELFP